MRRRALVFSGLGAAGALVVGWGLLPPRERIGGVDAWPAAEGEVGLNGWIKIAADGAVLLAMPRSEMGQGVHTALAMLAAEELDVPLERIRLVVAGPDRLYGNVANMVATLPFFHPRDSESGNETRAARSTRWVVAKAARELGINVTGGSSSVVDSWDVLRLAAATARARLVGAASLLWKQPAAELTVVDGVVAHEASGASAHYGELARMAAATPPGSVVVKARARWSLLGTAAPRLDLPAKVDGSAQFGVDTRLPGMLFAAIRHAPMLGGSPGPVDIAPALALAGVERVVRLGPQAGATEALAVVGRTWWHAQRGAAAIRVEWRAAPGPALDSAAIADDLEHRARAALLDDSGFAFHRRGDIAVAEAQAVRRVEQVYRAPYLAHAALEPLNCTARVANGQVELWLPTQVPGLAREAAAAVAGVDVSAVTLHLPYLGGGFGRRLEVDVVAQAVRIAVETGGRPVQLMWSREEEFGHDFYRPAAAAAMRASLDAAGRPTAWRFASAGDAVTPRWMERAVPSLSGRLDTPDKTASEGLFDQPYAVPHQRISHVATRSGVPVGYWRSVGHSHNAFFTESFVDELAHVAGRDPVTYRLDLLDDAPRHSAVLKQAAEQAGWPQHSSKASTLPAGHARGVALHESFGSVVAQIVEVSLEAGRPRLHRVVCVADVGTVVNPGIVAQQLEGGIVFALAAALDGRIDIADSVVRQRNFPDQPLLRLADTPRIETSLVNSERAPSGVGEIAVPPLAPALANALFALTGRRLRSLPLADGWS